MPEPPGGEKTIPASARKRQRAREQGNVAKSQDLNAAWTLLVALIALRLLGPSTFEELIAASRHFFGDAAVLLVEPDTIQTLAIDALMFVSRTVLPFMVVLLFGGIAINVVQVGVLFAPEAMRPRLEKLNPISGLQKFVSIRSLVELVKAICKLTIITYIVFITVRGRWQGLLVMMYMTPWGITKAIAELVAIVWLRAVLAMAVIGILDYIFQRWQHDRELMMTVQEAREEARQLEGDPRIRQRIRRIQRQLAMQRMMAEVPRADVVIINPTRFAVALRYEPPEMAAPVVIAKGARLIAERIRDLAIENDVPIVERPELARTLYQTIEVGYPVPEDLFRAVAEVLAFVYEIDRRVDRRRERARMMHTLQPAMG